MGQMDQAMGPAVAIGQLGLADQVLIAAMSGFEHRLSELLTIAPIAPDIRELALRLARDAGHQNIIAMLAVH